MTYSRGVLGLMVFTSLWLGGCSTMSSVETAADKFSDLADRSMVLAETGVEALDQIKTTVGLMDTHVTSTGEELEVMIPKLVADSTKLVNQFEVTTREMTESTKTIMAQTEKTIDEITPDIQQTLQAVSKTVETYGTSMEKMAADLGETSQALTGLVNIVKENTEQGREWIVATQEQLTASIASAQRALDQTADSFENIEKGLVGTMEGTQSTLQGINRVLRLEAEDDDEIEGLGRKIERAIGTFLWVFIGGGILLIVVATIFFYDRFTAKSRLKRQLEALGVDIAQLQSMAK